MSSTVMQPALPPGTAFVPPATLKDFNACLAQLDLPGLAPAAFATLKARESRDRLVAALRRALHGDANAVAYLRQVTGGGASAATAAPHPPLRLVPAAAEPPPAAPPVEPGPAATEMPASPPATAPPRRPGLPVYGKQGALTVEADQTRAGFQTLALDAAQASGPRQYDWAHKLRLQLTRQELPVVAAVLAGILPGSEFSHHGPDNNKGFSLHHQPERGVIFCRVFTKGRVIAVPIGAADAYYLTALALWQLCANTPGLTPADALMTLRATVGRLQGAPARTGVTLNPEEPSR